jgi:hypothetical protein
MQTHYLRGLISPATIWADWFLFVGKVCAKFCGQIGVATGPYGRWSRLSGTQLLFH